MFECAYQQIGQGYLGKRKYEEPEEYFKLVVSLIEPIYKSNSISLVDVRCAVGPFIYYGRKDSILCSVLGWTSWSTI